MTVISRIEAMGILVSLATCAATILAVSVLIAVAAPARRGRTAAVYRRKPVLSSWERAALPRLAAQLPAGLHLCPQVRLAEMLAIHAATPAMRTTAFNRVASKSVDFVVADLSTGNPILVIELDDASHRRVDRQKRDHLVDEALGAAGIAIVRFQPPQKLDIRSRLAVALSEAGSLPV